MTGLFFLIISYIIIRKTFLNDNNEIEENLKNFNTNKKKWKLKHNKKLKEHTKELNLY